MWRHGTDAERRAVEARRSTAPDGLARVALIGGPDVDARLELMRALQSAFSICAFGSDATLGAKFQAEGFAYIPYRLRRQVDPVRDLLTIGQLIGGLRKIRPQLVHAFDTKPGVLGCIAARLAGVPIVVGTVTGLGSLYADNRVRTRCVRLAYRLLQKLACRLSDFTVFQNHDDQRRFVRERIVSGHKTRVIPGSGVRTDVFDPAQVRSDARAAVRAEVGIASDEILVTMISRVIRSKGVLEFLTAADTVRRRHPRTRFLLVGADDLESPDRLTESERAWLGRSVTWPGPRRDVASVLAASDVFVLPTAYLEGVPRVLLEAASMGLPIVTTDSPGCRDVVQDGVNGLLTPVRDADALVQAVSRLIEQPELRQQFGQASRMRAIQQFDLSVVADQTLQMYRSLLQRTRSAGPRRARWARRSRTGFAKRLMDVVISVIALLAASPFLLIGALAVRLTSSGPVLYKARRAGLGGTPFYMLKLRTMRAWTDSSDRRITAAQDDRITPVGRLLRKFRLDELPQLWNVLRGEMSIVGPRPEDWEIVQRYYTAEQRRTLEVRPGLVSPADLRWYPDLMYHDPPPPGVSAQEHYLTRHMPAQLAECLRYVEEQSFRGDLKVVAEAVYCVLVRSWLPPRKRPLPADDAAADEERVEGAAR